MATGLRDGEKYYPVEHYCIKLRAYPNETQKKLITYILSGVHTFCNMVFYDVQTNNMYTKESVDKQSGEIVHWLDIKQAMKAENISRYRQQNPRIQIVPASAMSSPKYGCLVDASKQYKSETGKNLPVERVKHTYYSKMKPRRSYTYQETYSKIQSSENHNVIYANLCRLGKLKLRGWSDKARFDADGLTNFVQYIED